MTAQTASTLSTHSHDVQDYLCECRSIVLEEIGELVPKDTPQTGGLYALALDYPLREGKALRPALCIAVARALGGGLTQVLRSAAVLELYHNAFLVHDDVEDGSEKRRNADTLHAQWGSAIAINVGDAMLSLCMKGMLDNLELVGVGRSLRIFDAIARMSRETAEGQMLELRWIHAVSESQRWVATPRDYIRMVYKKTAWYSFITPMLVGAITTGHDHSYARQIHRFGAMLGIAFQIRDDLLNLDAGNKSYGKELAGDLWEGKHTLMIIHAIANASPPDRETALRILAKPRPRPGNDREGSTKTTTEVAFLQSLIREHHGAQRAERTAQLFAQRAKASFGRLAKSLPESPHKRFIEGLVDYVIHREN